VQARIKITGFLHSFRSIPWPVRAITRIQVGCGKKAMVDANNLDALFMLIAHFSSLS
jgi:hypothetical protein